ncbi:MAG: hypothetical protein ACOC4I_00105 [Spirochaetota bacterium]
MLGRPVSTVLLVTTLFAVCVSVPLHADEPVPYEREEFPQLLRDMRRFEIVTLGSLPLTMLFTSLLYRTYRIAASDTDISWAETRPTLQSERNTVLGFALSASTIVGLADYLLGLRERRSEPES